MNTSVRAATSSAHSAWASPYLTGAAVLLAGLAIASSPSAQAVEPMDSPDEASSITSWAYDPFGSQLFGSAARDDASRLASAGLHAIGAGSQTVVSTTADTDLDATREIPDETRFSAGNLNELWGTKVVAKALTDDAPMFAGSRPADPASNSADVRLPHAGATSGAPYAGTSLTSRVSEFDGSAGDLFKIYMRPEPSKATSGITKPTVDTGKAALSQPVLSHVKPTLTQDSALPSMPNRVNSAGTTLTSKVTRVERLSISSNMLRNVR